MVLRLNTVSYEFRSHLTVALSFAQFTGKGKNFTCNVFIISTHFFPSEAQLLTLRKQSCLHD